MTIGELLYRIFWSIEIHAMEEQSFCKLHFVQVGTRKLLHHVYELLPTTRKSVVFVPRIELSSINSQRFIFTILLGIY